MKFNCIWNRNKTWRDDELSGIKRKSNTTDGLPSKRMVSSEYSRYNSQKELSFRSEDIHLFICYTFGLFNHYCISLTLQGGSKRPKIWLYCLGCCILDLTCWKVWQIIVHSLHVLLTYRWFHCYATFEVKPLAVKLAIDLRQSCIANMAFLLPCAKIVHAQYLLQSTERPSTFPLRYRHLRREGLFWIITKPI